MSASPLRKLPPPGEQSPPALVAVPPLPRQTGAKRGGIPEPVPEPDPAFVGTLAIHGYQTVTGARSLSLLGPLVTIGLTRSLAAQRALFSDRRTVYRDSRSAAVTPHIGSVRIDRPQDETAEAAVMLHVGEQVRAVAIRLEWAHGHWRATDLTVL